MEQVKVPVMAALVPFGPHYRLVSFVISAGSPPLSYVVSRSSVSVYGKEHNCSGCDLIDFSSMESRVSRDEYLDPHGKPYEIGYGHLVNLDYSPNPVHPSSSAGISNMTYELLLILCQLKTFISCKSELNKYYLKGVELADCYEPNDNSMVRLSLKQPVYAPLIDAYESIVRFLCGGSQYDQGCIQDAYNLVFDHFRHFMSQKAKDMTDITHIRDVSPTFRMHRTVSYLSYYSVYQ